MKRWVNSILALLITVVLLASTVSVNVTAATYVYDADTDTIYYDIEDIEKLEEEIVEQSDVEQQGDAQDYVEQQDDVQNGAQDIQESTEENAVDEADTAEEISDIDYETETDVEQQTDELLNGIFMYISTYAVMAAATVAATSDVTPYSYSYTYTKLNSVTLSPSTVTVDMVLSEASTFISSMEGNYSTVVKNDNGALSIGKIQWHGANALQLVRLIISEDNDSAYNILGKTLYNEVINSATTWTTKIATDNEAVLLSNLLASTAGKKIQDKLLDSYISGYINHATALGITNAAALVIYADLENQRGYSGSKSTVEGAYSLAGSYSKITANEMLMASICCYSTSVTSLYSSFVKRRLSAYSYVVGLNWKYCNSGDYLIAYNSTVAKSTAAKWIQSTLNTINNAGLTVDGSFGSVTTAAVISFQSDRGLDADGIPGQNTITAMIKELYAYKTGATDSKTETSTDSEEETIVEEPESTLAISSFTYPSTLTVGSSFSIKGAIKSNYNISKVTVKVLNSSGKSTLSASATPNAKSYNVSGLDSKITFGKLSAGTYTYKVTATDTKGEKTLVNKTFTVKAVCQLKVKNHTYPSSLKYGSGFSIKGTITSDCKITKVTIKVINSSGKTVLSASAKPGAKSYSLAKLDAKIKFGTLAVGTYKYKVTATDGNGSKTLINKTFKVKSTSKLKISGYNYPKSIKKGSSFSIKGKITSNCKISKVTIKIVNSSGKTVISATAKPNAKSYSLAKLDAKIKFGSLAKGTYTYKVTAKDSQITKTLVKKTFKVK